MAQSLIPGDRSPGTSQCPYKNNPGEVTASTPLFLRHFLRPQDQVKLSIPVDSSPDLILEGRGEGRKSGGSVKPGFRNH